MNFIQAWTQNQFCILLHCLESCFLFTSMILSPAFSWGLDWWILRWRYSDVNTDYDQGSVGNIIEPQREEQGKNKKLNKCLRRKSLYDISQWKNFQTICKSVSVLHFLSPHLFCIYSLSSLLYLCSQISVFQSLLPLYSSMSLTPSSSRLFCLLVRDFVLQSQILPPIYSVSVVFCVCHLLLLVVDLLSSLYIQWGTFLFPDFRSPKLDIKKWQTMSLQETLKGLITFFKSIHFYLTSAL